LIWFWNCPDSVVFCFLSFHFILLIINFIVFYILTIKHKTYFHRCNILHIYHLITD
jgi:hypothetical protein